MNIIVAAFLFSVIILLYWIISELFTILFRFTGLPEEKARFQVTSLLTGCGFTTRESEMIITTRTRRRVARATMLFGYVFNITIVSALVNVLFSLKTAQVGGYVFGLLMPLGAIAFIFVFMRVPAIRSWGDDLMEKLAGRFVRGNVSNSVMILDYIGRDSIAQVMLNDVPAEFEGLPLAQTGIKAKYNILVMLVEHGNSPAAAANAGTIFIPGDKLTVFGDYKAICRAFNAKERFTE